jgi:hypothetical protein
MSDSATGQTCFSMRTTSRYRRRLAKKPEHQRTRYSKNGWLGEQAKTGEMPYENWSRGLEYGARLTLGQEDSENEELTARACLTLSASLTTFQERL